MRLFAALLPPDDVLAELADAVAALRLTADDARLRWTERVNWHITLAFYGEVAEDRLPGLRERLARTAGRGRPLRLRVAGGGRFGDRALWAGLTGGAEEDGEPADELRRLAASCAAAGRHTGLGTAEARHFRAHVTLARVRGRSRDSGSAPGPLPGAATAPGAGALPAGAPRAGAVDLRPYAAALDGFRSEPWTAGELALVRSTLPGSGVPGEQPRYAQVAAWALGG